MLKDPPRIDRERPTWSLASSLSRLSQAFTSYFSQFRISTLFRSQTEGLKRVRGNFPQMRMLVAAFAASLLQPWTTYAATPNATPIQQELFRYHASDAPLPVLPAHFGRTDFEGRVVVEAVVSGGGGALSSLKVIEASDAALAPATTSALSKWRFRPFSDTSPKLKDILLSSRLIFYFSVKTGRANVTDAVFEILERDRRRSEENKAKSASPGQNRDSTEAFTFSTTARMHLYDPGPSSSSGGHRDPFSRHGLV
jgi:hypothetical protein